MIETTIPAVDVDDLMQRVRAEAAKIAERSSLQQQIPDRRPVNSPSPAVLPPPPAPVTVRPVNLKRERLDNLLHHAREDTRVARWIPKFLRGLFRKQAGFNRNVLDALTSLVKTNAELTSRVHELSSALDAQGHWLNLLPGSRAADAAWMRAVEQKVTVLSATATEQKESLQGQMDRLGTHVVNLQNAFDAADAKGHLSALQGQLDRLGTHVGNLQNAFDAADAERHLAALQGQLDRLGAHVVNLQNEVNAIRDTSRSWGEPLRAVDRQVEQEGLRINHLQFEIGKNQTETRFAQRTLEQMASRRSSLEQQLTRLDDRQAEDAAFIKAIVSEHAALLQRFVTDDAAVLQR
ncbi:MAG: hypothetical protein ABR526_07180 [Chthoniobacterales bacterium]